MGKAEEVEVSIRERVAELNKMPEEEVLWLIAKLEQTQERLVHKVNILDIQNGNIVLEDDYSETGT